MKILFSIIIPIYKVEKYIHKCIDSILNQTFQEYEIILVNDGSPDNCPQICDEYAKQDSRIKVIHKENGGVGSARNTGIKNAKGEYIIFLDSDDMMVNNCLIEVYNFLKENDCDILFCNFIVNYKGKIKEKDFSFIVDKLDSKGENIIDNIIKYNVINPCWNKVYKTRFIIDNGIFFNNYILAEDFNWGLELLLKNPKCQYANIDLIEYKLFRKGSVTERISLKKMLNNIDVSNKWLLLLKSKKNATNYFIKQYLASVNDYYKLENEKRKIFRKEFYKNDLSKYAINSKETKMQLFLINILGLYLFSFLKSFIIKVRRIIR